MASHGDEAPRAADLRQMFAERPLPAIDAATVNLISLSSHEATAQAQSVLSAFQAALSADDAAALETCFFAQQAHWKDILALTCHLRTFYSPRSIALNFLHTRKLRGAVFNWTLEKATFVPAAPDLQFIDVSLSFKTTSPSASCSGRLLLLPLRNGRDALQWKIWILSTKLEALDSYPENTSLLGSPGRDLNPVVDTIKTDVLIIGGGNGGLALAARLKAFDVDYIIMDKHVSVGDNWALRYDCMKLHVPTSFAELPYMTYEEQLQAPHLLTRDDLVKQLRRFVDTFRLNIIESASIQYTTYDKNTKLWTVKYSASNLQRTVVSKHIVQATGVGSQLPHIPAIRDTNLYQGLSIHSKDFKSGKQLVEQGVKSVLVVGSANTAFDVLEDCHAAGIQVTMNVRSPTYIVPLEYWASLFGVYELSVDEADRMSFTLPTVVEGQLTQKILANLALKERDRYAALAEAGFPVVDSADSSQALSFNLLERGGGHYVDIGGLRFSDNSTVDADGIIWCTGFADVDVGPVTGKILGGGGGSAGRGEEGTLSPSEIASRLDSTWHVDCEGEVRGMWKRQLRLDNYWIMGGFAQQHRWHSRTLALQIKAALQGSLPPAYRDTK